MGGSLSGGTVQFIRQFLFAFRDLAKRYVIYPHGSFRQPNRCNERILRSRRNPLHPIRQPNRRNEWRSRSRRNPFLRHLSVIRTWHRSVAPLWSPQVTLSCRQRVN